MQKEDVLAYIRAEPLFHSFDVPYICEAVVYSSLLRAIVRLHGSKWSCPSC